VTQLPAPFTCSDPSIDGTDSNKDHGLFYRPLEMQLDLSSVRKDRPPPRMQMDTLREPLRSKAESRARFRRCPCSGGDHRVTPEKPSKGVGERVALTRHFRDRSEHQLIQPAHIYRDLLVTAVSEATWSMRERIPWPP
jgi:hypothetical protein